MGGFMFKEVTDPPPPPRAFTNPKTSVCSELGELVKIVRSIVFKGFSKDLLQK